ncbi:hypothetical protein LH462_01545 [Laribacter hongkongensis]|uniref:Uncharacterized protein n=1 Tax=Laribacter hongkongensis TaxID=168471 RepID=A0ABD4SPD4_9NEIS|nr:hypothetical protein [Laribacter hongkongensis]MCG9024857.1 hypothetical protein [Laribacter hongkongensis]MCG9059841.1 hypothetical protein [Laribacter hongkongensis]MCG9084803.1 hypothetical protein [Laribacter hongkongensis]MCG9102421.1 hypothetical protein [Laribacter hongkongensis]MCG9112463.1 hypothetical protein [Laribacter hongkongensis]
MKFSKAYRESLRFWPTVIDISDGQLQEGDKGYFPLLSKCWDIAESHADTWSEWHKLMVWAIFCGLHKTAINSFRLGAKKINKHKIDKSYVEYKFSESLFYIQQSSYPRQMKRAYINDLRSKKT